MSEESQNLPEEAMVDLLIKQITEGLSAAEQRELDVTDSARASTLQRDLERAAAAISIAGTVPVELPAGLRDRLLRRGDEHLAAVTGVGTARRTNVSSPLSSGDTRQPDRVVAMAAPRSTIAGRPVPASRGGAWGWLAAAACLVLAALGWFRAPPAPVPVTTVVVAPPVDRPPPERLPPAPPTPAEERAALMAKADTVKVTLGPTKDPSAVGVSGDVVWDPATQTGYVHFVGLAANDPQLRQYQIWVFDGKRDKRYPLSAGVFDVAANASEVTIPIHAELPITLAKAFAVTVERPGGVVVSALGHVVAMGAVG